MAEKSSPTLSTAWRVAVVMLSAAAMLGGILLARLTISEDDLLPFMAVALAPGFLLFGALMLISRRTQMAHDERKMRTASELLQTPYWQALFIYGSPPALTPIAIVALSANSVAQFAERSALLTPIVVLTAALVLHFLRREARQQLDKTDA